jgi:hypothetical protein
MIAFGNPEQREGRGGLTGAQRHHTSILISMMSHCWKRKYSTLRAKGLVTARFWKEGNASAEAKAGNPVGQSLYNQSIDQPMPRRSGDGASTRSMPAGCGVSALMPAGVGREINARDAVRANVWSKLQTTSTQHLSIVFRHSKSRQPAGPRLPPRTSPISPGYKYAQRRQHDRHVIDLVRRVE